MSPARGGRTAEGQPTLALRPPPAVKSRSGPLLLTAAAFVLPASAFGRILPPTHQHGGRQHHITGRPSPSPRRHAPDASATTQRLLLVRRRRARPVRACV